MLTITIERRGLYGGMGMHLLRSVPNAAIMFLSFELVSKWLAKDTVQQRLAGFPKNMFQSAGSSSKLVLEVEVLGIPKSSRS